MSPRDMGPGSRTEANKLETPSPWLVLYEVQISAVERVYIVNNEEPVTYGDNVYRPFPVTLETLEETLSGDIPGMNLVVSNITREFSALLQHRRGLLDRPVIMRVVHKDFLEEIAIEHRFTIRTTHATESQATFLLSVLPFMELEMPYRRFHRDACDAVFGGLECGWGFGGLPGGVASSTSCSKRRLGPNGCQAHGDAYAAAGHTPLWPARMNAFPSIPRRRV